MCFDVYHFGGVVFVGVVFNGSTKADGAEYGAGADPDVVITAPLSNFLSMSRIPM